MTSWTDIANRLKNLESKTTPYPLKPTPGDNTGWFCMKPDCLYADKGFINYPTRRFCNGCFTPREVAERPPPQRQRPQQQRRVPGLQGTNRSSELAATKEEKKEKRLAKRAARQAWKDNNPKKTDEPVSAPVAAIPREGQAPVPATTAAPSPASSNTPSAKKLFIPEDLTLRTPLLTEDVLKSIKDSLALEVIPPLADTASPEVLVQKALGDRGPAAKVAKVAELQANITAFKTMIITAQTNGDTMGDVEKMLNEKLEAAEAALSKAQKDAPSQLSELRAVQEAKSSYELKAQTRKDLQQKGLAKALERKAERHLYIKQSKDQWDILDQGLNDLEAKNYQAHAARAAAMTDIDDKVFALFDAKITALQQAPQVQVTGQLALPQVQAPSAPLNAITELEDLKKKVAEQQALIAQQHAKMQETYIAAVQKQNELMQKFERRFEEILPAMLPAARVPEKEHIAAIGATHSVLQGWQVAGAASPFAWDALDTLVGPGLEGTSVAKELVGDAIWQKWYPDALPQSSEVVPQQLTLLILKCLDDITQAFEDSKDAITTLATQGAVKVRDSTKRLRTV